MIAGPNYEVVNDEYAAEIELDSKEALEIAQKQKQHIFEWLGEADFTEDFDLLKVGMHPFKMSELESNLRGEALIKLIKVAYYKIGMVYKRQDLYKQELLEKVKDIESTVTSKNSAKISAVESSIHTVME
jgi:hypothetical protein